MVQSLPIFCHSNLEQHFSWKFSLSFRPSSIPAPVPCWDSSTLNPTAWKKFFGLDRNALCYDISKYQVFLKDSGQTILNL